MHSDPANQGPKGPKVCTGAEYSTPKEVKKTLFSFRKGQGSAEMNETLQQISFSLLTAPEEGKHPLQKTGRLP